jgi:putative alpha-1,2-mannosidase
MAKAVADVSGDNQGGFASDSSSITGFSHMHDSGTGGSPSLGNFPIFPSPPCPGNDLDKCKWTKADRAIPRVNDSVVASPGYFAIGLSSGINAEMTVANHTALYRLKFPSGNAGNVILMDATDIPDSRQRATLHVDPQSGRMTGNGTFVPSFGIGTYTLYVCADFQGAKVKDAGVWVNKRAGTETQVLHVEADGINNNPPLPAGVFVRFDEGAKEVSVRVGVSLMNIDQACYNAESEIPKFDFENTKKAAEDAWRKKLGVVEVKTGGANETMQKVFWSGLYRTMLSPQDYTGENPLWKSDEPYYDSYYCIWDSFRSVHPLITLVDPVSQSLMVRSLLDIYKHEGMDRHLPRSLPC